MGWGGMRGGGMRGGGMRDAQWHLGTVLIGPPENWQTRTKRAFLRRLTQMTKNRFKTNKQTNLSISRNFLKSSFQVFAQWDRGDSLFASNRRKPTAFTPHVAHRRDFIPKSEWLTVRVNLNISGPWTSSVFSLALTSKVPNGRPRALIGRRPTTKDGDWLSGRGTHPLAPPPTTVTNTRGNVGSHHDNMVTTDVRQLAMEESGAGTNNTYSPRCWGRVPSHVLVLSCATRVFYSRDEWAD